MTDGPLVDSDPAEAVDPAEAAALRRRRRRRREEFRFRAYGVIALSVAAAALATLILTISISAAPAFTQHVLRLDIPLEASRIDPNGRIAEIEADETLSEAERARNIAAVVRRADFAGMLRDALRTEFPEVTERRARRELNQLVSPINAGAIARTVAADPSLIGGVYEASVPIGDDIDQFLKGTTPLETFSGRGEASVSGVDGEIEINSQANDFVEILQDLRTRLATEADRLEAEADRRERLADRLEDEGEADLQRYEAERRRVRAEDYRRRAAATGAAETLTDALPSVLIAINGGLVRASTLDSSRVVGEVLIPLESAAGAASGAWEVVKVLTPEADRRITDRQIAWAWELIDRGALTGEFNTTLFANADSRDPELAGVRGALIGSILTMIVTMALAVPIGIFAAIYLEEFAPKNWLTDFIEVNINNLAAVPSIVFGLLGLAVFINVFALPRSAPLVGGMVLALMTLPTIIIATRAALKAVPASVRSGALGLGASPVQTVFHHVLPLALPGVMTGSIIGLAQALGETAPLLMIGMVAFVADAPTGFTDASVVMPVQIFIWSNAAERAFDERTSAAILVLLSLMVFLNLLAVYVRRRFERRW